MKKLGVHFSLNTWWQFASTLVIVAAALGLLLVNDLETLLPGYSTSEVAATQTIQSLSHIASNPANAPYNVVAYVINVFLDNALLSVRFTSILFGAAILALFYIGTRYWYAPRTAFLATTLLACSAWFLHIARLGTPDILLAFSLLLLATSSYWIASGEHSKFSYFAAILAVGITIYTPGMIWLLCAGLYFRRKDIRLLKRRLSTPYRIALYIFGIGFIMAPLLYALSTQPRSMFALLGFPETWPSVIEFIKNLLEVPLNLLAWSNLGAQYQLANLPLLDTFAIIMLPLGIYYYFKFRTLLRVKLLAIIFLVSWILVGLGGSVTIAILLPIVYLVVAAGVALLLSQWLVVFPRNPLAKSVGVLLVTAAVALSCVYNLRAYFVAWPNNQETKQEFTQTSENLVQ